MLATATTKLPRQLLNTKQGSSNRALTRCWVAIESLKLSNNCRYSLRSIENVIFHSVREVWWQSADLQESLDTLEVFDFVYGFLCQHIDSMKPYSIAEWVDDTWLGLYQPRVTRGALC